MINLRKTAVLLFIGIFTMSMVLVPFTPRAAVDSQVAAPINYENALVEKYADLLENDQISEKMDPILASYIETGVLDKSVVTTTTGEIKVLLYVEPTFDTKALAGIAEVRWQTDLKIIRVASIDVSSVGALKQLEAMRGIHYVMADVFINREVIGSQDPVIDMFNINDVVGATGTYASGYDGAGVIVGVDDTGIDFSQTDMHGTEYNNGTMAMSYDPSGYGLTEMYIGNNTFVENTTAWLEAGNVLTYEMGGNYYLNVTGWDPVCNNVGGHRTLISGFIGIYEGAWGINNGTEYVTSELWKDWQIPAPGAENYTFGWVFQQRIEGYAKVFAASMYYEGDLIIDWDSSLAWTTMWYDAFWAETADLNVTADRDVYTAMMDWSFEDDRLLGRLYNINNNLLYADNLDDGSGSMGLGSISWAYDDLGYLANDYGLFPGITADGMVWNALFPGGSVDDSNHGHWTGAAIASQGSYAHDVYGNGTTYNLPGVAPGAKLIACKGLSTGGYLMADWWAAGFHLNESAGPYANETYWTYGGDGVNHKAHIISNSWGWGPGAGYLQLMLYTMVYDIASVPDVMATGYPGTLFVFSAGNEGGDYGTAGTPGATFSVVSVGASITGHYYESVYASVTQTDNQEIYFSSNGPGFTGIVKPDVMAPGYRGANPQPSQNEWLGAGDTFYWWQGTSLACPVAAGVAALIMEAWHDAHGNVMPSPQLTKDLLLSSATDLGYDPYIQGHGLVNAEAAIAAIESGAADAFYFESASFENYADQMLDAWVSWIPGWSPFGDIYYDAAWDTPVGLETSSLFFGTVERSESKVVNLDVTGYDGTPATASTFTTSGSITPWYYTEGSRVSFSETSYTYNDTHTNVIRPGVFFLADNVSLTNFYAANYATITVTYDFADIGAYPVVRLFDWVDVVVPGEFNYYNFTAGTGDYIDHITRYTDQCNMMQMRVASTSGIASLFTGEPVLQFDGPAGIDFTVTIQNWATTVDGAISVADGSTGLDVTLDVPTDAEYGAHEGMLRFDDGAGFTHEVPYSYMVDFNLNGPKETPMTLVDGAGAELTPFDTGAATTSYTSPATTRTQEGGGQTTFHIDIPYNIAINASILVMKATWVNDGTVVDMYLREETYPTAQLTGTNDGGRPFNPQPTGDKTNTIIWDPGHLINGTYWFYYSVHRIDGTSVPEDVTITMQLYNATDLAAASTAFTWTANDHPSPTPIVEDDVLVGDHVVVESSWTIPSVSGLPEYSILTATQLSFLSGLYVERDGYYADPQGTDAWPIALASTDLYVWETFDGVAVDDITTVTLDAQGNADPSFDVYMWDDANANDLVELDELGGSLLSVDNGGGGAVESGVFTVPATGSLAIRVFCWDWAFNHQAYTLIVDSQVSIDIDSEAGSLEFTSFDTYNFERNITFKIFLYCWGETDVSWTINFGQVRFENFYPPVVSVNAAIDLTGDLWNFTWTASDGNIDDSLYFSVWISSDDGLTFQLILANLTETFYVWDSSGFLVDNYHYRIRVHDCDHTYPLGVGAASDPPTSYWPGLFSDSISAAFEAGNVLPPTTTTTTTTTTTPTPTEPPPVFDPLVIGLLGGIGVGVVILLILFLIRKK